MRKRIFLCSKDRKKWIFAKKGPPGLIYTHAVNLAPYRKKEWRKENVDKVQEITRNFEVN